MNKPVRLNEAIRAPQLRVIDQDGKQLGIYSRAEALGLAAEQELDLIEISPDADPPVAKITDWGKYNYKQTKQSQKNRKNAKNLDVKQMRIGLKISDHDLGVKLRKVNSFLEAGHKVKLVILYRGRELAHKELGFKLAEKIIADYGDKIAVDQPPQLLGKQLTVLIRSNTGAKAKNS